MNEETRRWWAQRYPPKDHHLLRRYIVEAGKFGWWYAVFVGDGSEPGDLIAAAGGFISEEAAIDEAVLHWGRLRVLDWPRVELHRWEDEGGAIWKED